MKKIISLLLLAIFVSTNYIWIIQAQDTNIGNNIINTVINIELTDQQIAEQSMKICSDKWWSPSYDFVEKKCSCYINKQTYPCESIPDITNVASCSERDNERIPESNWTCPENYVKDSFSNENWTFNCCNPNPSEEKTSNSIMGISCNEDQLLNGQCKLNVYDTLGIRQTVRDEGDATSVGLFVQDIVLSATFFIGTVVTIALIVSWLMFIFAASSGKDPANAKKGIVGSLIGLLLVVSSYVIIRLVQYIAKGF